MADKLNIEIIPHGGEVMLVFNDAYKWIAFPPQGARDLARLLIQGADQIEGTVTGTKQ